ncbi:hypothetical protein H5410_014724 [Solanum commersonii]|uniref:Uncharacterized protein n=1 Tax=Solanum commersonii TaxID=4109 RepID=A0A9J5ZS94_SOLCO|nr:hypothetical protein H5410_014724 [Solanum commersonii]
MWASSKKRQPMAGNRSQVLHASVRACAHLANNVGQRHATSAKAYTNQMWRRRNGKASPKWRAIANEAYICRGLASINSGVCALDK